MIQCNKCYADNRDDALYCRRCGEKFPDLADQILQRIIGQDRAVKVIRQLAEYYLMLKRNSSHGQRPDMDILLKGSSGTGKDFIANIIQEYFFKKGIVQKQMVMVDAADFEAWMDKKTTDDFKALGGGILFINNIHMLIHDNNNISPIDVLFSRMESWETDSTAGWDTYPIIIMAGHPINIDKFFKEKPAGLNRFAKVLDLQDMNADTLSRICQNCLEKDLPVSEEASQRIFGFFRNVIRNRKVDFRNAWEAIDKCNNIHYQAMIHHHSGVEPDDITGEVYEPRSLADILAEIDSYVGIEEVKEEVHSIVRMVQKAKAENPNADVRLKHHYLFLGNPGTGKTTIARLFGDILYQLGVLPNGQFVEVRRESLVGEYIGQTAPKTMRAVESAMGGVLFIDEAYMLGTGSSSSSSSGGKADFGSEAIDTLLGPLENQKGDFVCIAAGYTKEMMERFVPANPGIDRRFDKKITFHDYTAPQLHDIFMGMLKKQGYTLSDEAAHRLPQFFQSMYNRRTANFGNAGVVRNTLQDAIDNYSKRIIEQQQPDDHVLTPSDIEGEEATKKVDINEMMASLDKDFIGMSNVKQLMKGIADDKNFIELQLSMGIDPNNSVIGLNIVLEGNPGTGKTTVARTIGKMLYAMKVLPSDRFVERQRDDIIGALIDSGAENMNKAFDLAMGGTLFIDEAYRLAPRGAADAEGRKAIDTLMRRMHDDRGKLCVILAGYKKDMDYLMNINEGFKSRINYTLVLKDYSLEELADIFCLKATNQKNPYRFGEGARQALLGKIEDMLEKRTENWGNAREMENLFKAVTKRTAARLQRMQREGTLTKEDFFTFVPDDFYF